MNTKRTLHTCSFKGSQSKNSPQLYREARHTLNLVLYTVNPASDLTVPVTEKESRTTTPENSPPSRLFPPPFLLFLLLLPLLEECPAIIFFIFFSNLS